MVKFVCAAALALLSLPAFAQECPVTTNSNSILRQAPGAGFAQLGTVPAGTVVPVEVCFDRGAFCAVTTQAGPGFISGDLLALPSGATLRSLEAERWTKIDAAETAGPAAFDRCNIVVWGDELATGAFAADLQRLLGRAVGTEGIAGEDLKAIAMRLGADIRYEGRIAIIWDHHADGATPEQYVADLAPIVEKARSGTPGFVIVSDIADPAADPAPTTTINDAVRSAYPDNFLDVTAVLADPATRSGGLQLSEAGASAVAGAIAAFIQLKGW